MTPRFCHHFREKNYVTILVQYAKDNGCIGGDWNSIVDSADATKNSNSKKSNGLSRLIRNFSWLDSFRVIYPNNAQFSRYYDIANSGEGASRLDRMYHYGNFEILDASYVGVAFSDHLALVVKIKAPNNFAKLRSPKRRAFYK